MLLPSASRRLFLPAASGCAASSGDPPRFALGDRCILSRRDGDLVAARLSRRSSRAEEPAGVLNAGESGVDEDSRGLATLDDLLISEVAAAAGAGTRTDSRRGSSSAGGADGAAAPPGGEASPSPFAPFGESATDEAAGAAALQKMKQKTERDMS